MINKFRRVLDECKVPNYYPAYHEIINEEKAADMSNLLARKIAVDFAIWLGIKDEIEDDYDKFIKEYTNDN